MPTNEQIMQAVAEAAGEKVEATTYYCVCGVPTHKTHTYHTDLNALFGYARKLGFMLITFETVPVINEYEVVRVEIALDPLYAPKIEAHGDSDAQALLHALYKAVTK